MALQPDDVKGAPDRPSLLMGAGEMAARIEEHDWSHSLGPIEQWPQSLKTAVSLIVRSPVAIVMLWGEDGIMIYNDAYSIFAGSRHPELLGSKVREGWPEVADFNDHVLRTCLAGGTLNFTNQELVLQRSGKPEQAWMNLYYSPVIDESGKAGGVIAIVIETTVQVLAERRRAADQIRQGQLLQQMPGFVAVLEGTSHIFRYANDAYVEVSSGRPLLGLSVREAFPELDGQGFYELLDQVYATGEQYVADAVPIQLTTGKRFIDLLYAPIRVEDGTVAGIFVGGYDVTERKSIEIALEQANEALETRVAQRTSDLENIRTFYTHSSECHAIISLREDGQFQYDEINPATLKLYGMTRDQVIGRTIDEIFESSRAAELSNHLVEALRRGAPYRYVRRQGNSAVEAIATPIPAEPGKLERLAVTARDTTEQLALEERLRQAQKMEAVGQLTGGIAHDFNNLLQGITGSLDRAQQRIAIGKANEADRFLKAAADSANRAGALTHRLLAFSRRQPLDTRPADLNQLIAGMEELISRTMTPSVAVEFVGAVSLWAVRVDISQLENSLLNLCINARDAMPNGGKLTIETANKWMDGRAAKERDLPEGQYVSLCVSDTGTGMSAETISRAFDPFFTTKPLGQGTGLGLSMIYGFVRQSGGQVRIYSELGKGTTMCLYFPRHFGTAGDANEPEALEKVEPGSGETVLIVDDEATVRMLVVEILTEAGYHTLEAGDGPAALRILQSNARIDLLITDVGLPGGLNGRQVADAARELRKKLKVLFITGFAENAVVGNGHLEPGMEILAKPFAMSALGNKVRELLDG
jgi:PAS domain S-box-containing protein